MTDTVRDDAPNSRFVLEIEGSVAELVYRAAPGRLVLLHTEVPAALEGKGIGGQLVRAAAAHAVNVGATIVPWCPFARRWLREHPDVAGTVTIDWTEPPAIEEDN